ncbi:MAG: DJ-1/PfpI family protein [Pseudomonadota bacterium]
MDISKRNLLVGGGGLGLAAAVAPFAALAEAAKKLEDLTAEEAMAVATQAHAELMEIPGVNMHGSEQVGMLVYPGMTMLDMVGPQYFFASMMGATVHLVTKDKTLAPIMGDTGFAIIPTTSMAECPKDLDVLFAPGGTAGTLGAMADEETLDFMADRGSRARYVTSVCTGSLILGQAGLLEGKKATSHWATRELLDEFGAIPTNQRVVKDGNVVTGAGVSAGLDFALMLLAELRSEPYAKAIQFQAEYAPDPHLNAGSEDTIDPEIGEPLREMFATLMPQIKAAAASRRS